MCGLTLQEADAIVQGALGKARELKCSPDEPLRWSTPVALPL